MAKRSRLQLKKKDLLAESKVWFNVPLDVKDEVITGYPAAKNELPAESKVLFEFTVAHKCMTSSCDKFGYCPSGSFGV